jgi:hypothetical protein
MKSNYLGSTGRVRRPFLNRTPKPSFGYGARQRNCAPGGVYPLDQRDLQKHPHPAVSREELETAPISVAETTQSNLVSLEALTPR